MLDDIIVTLRQEYEYFNAGKGGDYETILQAIGEIERLRAENESLRHAISEQNRLNRVMNIQNGEA